MTPTGGTTNRLRLNANVVISGTLTGNSLIRTSGSFSGTLTRSAVYIPGTTTNDYAWATAKSVDGIVRPVSADNLSVYCKTDSVVVLRVTGTGGTSNLGYNVWRGK
jgi:hypothetical protein